jgi:hypothetical protein
MKEAYNRPIDPLPKIYNGELAVAAIFLKLMIGIVAGLRNDDDEC